MARVAIKDNEIYAIFDIKDVKTLRVGILGGDIKEVEILTKNGGLYITDKEFYIYCLQRMTECNVFIEIELYTAIGHEVNTKIAKDFPELTK